MKQRWGTKVNIGSRQRKVNWNCCSCVTGVGEVVMEVGLDPRAAVRVSKLRTKELESGSSNSSQGYATWSLKAFFTFRT